MTLQVGDRVRRALRNDESQVEVYGVVTQVPWNMENGVVAVLWDGAATTAYRWNVDDLEQVEDPPLGSLSDLQKWLDS